MVLPASGSDPLELYTERLDVPIHFTTPDGRQEGFWSRCVAWLKPFSVVVTASVIHGILA